VPSDSQTITVGYEYYLGAHMGLVHGPVDSLSRIRVADKVAWVGSVTETGTAIEIDQNQLFGGLNAEGGIKGTIRFENGEPTAIQNGYLLTQLGPTNDFSIPAFRGVTCVVLEQPYVSANNPYLKPWAFLMTRTDITTRGAEQWYVATARIGGEEETGELDWEVTSGANTLVTEENGVVTITTDAAADGTGNLVLNAPAFVEYFLVGSGGASQNTGYIGNERYAGSGAGQIVYKKVLLEAGTYPFVVGNRKLNDTSGSTTGCGTRGADSTFNGDTAKGGGGGVGRCESSGTGDLVAVCDDIGWHGGGAAGAPSGIYDCIDRGATGKAGTTGGRGYPPTAENGFAVSNGGGSGYSGSYESLEDVDIDALIANGGNGDTAGNGGTGTPGLLVDWTGTALSLGCGGAGGGGTSIGALGNLGAKSYGSGGGANGQGEKGVLMMRVTSQETTSCPDMNPAHIIRECLTDKEWGMGYTDADIDDVAFTAAADTLYAEQMGISILWQRENTIEAFVQDIVRHIDAALYVDRRTGKFVLKLIRSEATPTLTLGPNNIERVENYKRPAFGDLVNSVTVIYDDCDDGKLTGPAA